MHEPWPVVVGFVIGIVVAGLCGYAIGKLSFRVRGAYFVIVTISFAEVTRLVALNWVELTQGPLALNNIPPFTLALPGLGEYTLWGKVPNYYVVLAVGALAYVVIRRLVLSRIGRAMIALRENEPLATSLGIDVTRYLVLAAVVSAAIAGAAGALYAHFVQDHRSRHLSLHLHRDDGDHGHHRRQGNARRARSSAGSSSACCPWCCAPSPRPIAQWIIYGVADDPDRVLPAARHRAGGARVVGADARAVRAERRSARIERMTRRARPRHRARHACVSAASPRSPT